MPISRVSSCAPLPTLTFITFLRIIVSSCSVLQEALSTPSTKRPLHPYLPLDLIFSANRREIFSGYRGKVSDVKLYERVTEYEQVFQ